MIFIEDFDHMTTMDENMNWMKLTHLLSIFSLNFKPLCASTVKWTTLQPCTCLSERDTLQYTNFKFCEKEEDHKHF